MNRDAWLAYYNNSPLVVQDYLLDPLANQRENEAQKKLAYDNDAWERVMDIVWDVIFTGIAKTDFQTRIKQVAGDRKPDEVEKTVLFNVVLPMADLATWDVEAALKELGLSESEIQSVPRISLRPVSYGAAVRRIAANAKLSLLSEEMVRRVRDAFVSYVKGIRTIEQFMEILLRNQNEGGLGFSRVQVDQYVAAMKEFSALTQVMSEEEYGRWMADYENRKTEDRRQKTGVGEGTPDEIAAMAAGPKAAPATALDAAVEEAVTQINHPELDEYLQKRLRNLVSTRLRDVRNTLQVKEVLQRGDKVGGLGFAPEEVERVSGLIETVYQEQRAKVEAEEKTKIEGVLADQTKKIEERRQRESTERAQWYEEKTRTSQTAQQRQAQAFASLQQMTPPVTSGGLTVERSVPSQALAAQEPAKPRLDAIRPPIKLTGLTEEVGGLTLEEFRRLSRSPQQAADKLRQKIDALKQESFERWTEGIQAWRSSPLQQQYLKLVTESFAAGQTVAELVERRHREDPNLPTPEELSALIALNSQLQF